MWFLSFLIACDRCDVIVWLYCGVWCGCLFDLVGVYVYLLGVCCGCVVGYEWLMVRVVLMVWLLRLWFVVAALWV